MENYTKRQRLDIELVRNLNERDFTKVSSTLKNYEYKYGQNGVVKYLKCEMKTEELFEECQGDFQKSISEATFKALEKPLSNISANDNEKESLLKAYEESRVVLMKLYFIKGKLDKCSKVFNELSSKIKVASLRKTFRPLMVADAHAMKGICIEKENPNDSESAIESYETAIVFLMQSVMENSQSSAKLATRPSQRSFTASPSTTSINISPIMYTCLNRFIYLLLKKKKTKQLLPLLRQLLETTKAQTFGAIKIRYLASYHLAALLTRDLSKSNYEPKVSYYERFKKFVQPVDNYAFVHETILQEMLLVLKISETMLNLDPLLDMSPAFSKARSNLLQKADCLYNQTVVSLLPRGFQSQMLSSFNPSLKYTFDHHHLWQLYALIQCQSVQSKAAISALKECYRIKESPHIALMIAKKSYEMMHQSGFDDGISFSEKALEKMTEMEHMSIEKSRAWLCIGIGKALKARVAEIKEDKKTLRREALEAYENAHSMDKFDPTPILFSAVELAIDRKIGLSFAKVKQVLHLDPEYLPALHLIALLLTSKQQYTDAKASVNKSLDMYPNDPLLLSIKCNIELVLGCKDSALQTCLEFCKLTSTIDHKNNTGVLNLEDMNNGSSSKYTPSLMKGGDSSDRQSTILGICGKTTNEQRALTKAWLLVAEVYFKCERYKEVEDCLNEAVTLNPIDPSISVIRGRLQEVEKNLEGALHLYNLALTTDPSDSRAIHHLSHILFSIGNLDLAENLLRSAATMDITSHTIWFKLGKVMEANKDYDNAMQCFTYALNLEATCPVVPFTSIILEL